MDALGIAVDRPIARLRECLELIRYVLRGRVDGYHGSVFSVASGVTLQYTPPRREVPITLGTWGEKTARALGPLVDEVKIGGSTLARREVAVYLSVVAGLDGTIDDPEWVRRVRAHGEDYASIGRDISDEMLDRFAFAGTARDIVQQVQELYAAGATRVEFGTPHGLDAETGIRLLGGYVVPALKELTRV
jgi:5,10-methylenetetrahydromethanopterin reductase